MNKIALTLLWTMFGAFCLSALSGCSNKPVQLVPSDVPGGRRDTRTDATKHQ